ncbi:MAG: C25 family cysteine peptidase [Anaerolineae bacterium]
MQLHVSQSKETPLIILSSRALLSRRYGDKGFASIHEGLRQLQNAIGLGQATLAYVDDERTLAPYGVAPVSPKDPAAIRTLVEHLERNLSCGRSATLWIIGGHEVIPFFRLPNPADDPDSDILSDAPYACLGADLYRPVRVVSRLPDFNPERGAAFVYASLAARRALSLANLNPKVSFSKILKRPASNEKPARQSCGGYTASVWREAAQEVFSLLESPTSLRMSPPWAARDYRQLRLAAARIKYFNLHGKPDGAIWYGQRDPALAADYPDFPVALRQSDIAPADALGALVITEACYGATLDQFSIADRFLHLGASLFLGSTSMAYGAIAPPVTGADLLAKEFLRYLLAGAPAGQAYLAAKIAFMRAMMTEQGFLDAEDQKTLLSFLLLGDPTLVLSDSHNHHGSAIEQPIAREELPEVVCARAIPDSRPLRVQASLLDELEYLASALLAGEAHLNCHCRQGTCKHLPMHRHCRLNPGGGEVVAFRHLLPTGAVRLAKFTLLEGRITKAAVSR